MLRAAFLVIGTSIHPARPCRPPLRLRTSVPARLEGDMRRFRVNRDADSGWGRRCGHELEIDAWSSVDKPVHCASCPQRFRVGPRRIRVQGAALFKLIQGGRTQNQGERTLIQG